MSKQDKEIDRRRILVVDDDPGLLEIVQAILEFEGYVVVTATDGPEALAKVRAERPDLIIMDLMMPGMNGFEVCRVLQASPRTSGIPIVMLTGKGQIEDPHRPGEKWSLEDGIQKRMEAYESGALQFLNKPVGASELMTAVKQLLALDELARR